MSKYTQKEVCGLYELTDAARAELTMSKYYNEDLAPTSLSQRVWSTYNISMLWVGMAICIPSLTMSSSLVVLGLSPWLAVLNVALGNLIVLIPMQLNSHAGTKYGIPFPVFARLTFGPIGAHIPSLSRAIIACGWCAIQSWIGGAGVVSIISAVFPPFGEIANVEFVGFAIFLIFVFYIAYKGSESIKKMESLGSPILILLLIALLIWSTTLAFNSGFGVGDILSATTDSSLIASNGGFLYIFLAGINANIAFWALMALNIPDFSRYAKSQKVQFRGQLYGMPLIMAICAFIGAYFAQSTKLAFGEAIFNPTEILPMLDSRLMVFIVGFGVFISTLTTIVAANVVAPSNGFSNVSPTRITYKTGVLLTCLLAIAFRPWWIYSDAGSYIFVWLNNCGALVAPIAAILISDYYIVKKRNLDVMALFQGEEGRYWYKNGWNLKAVFAWFCGFILPLLGGTILAEHTFFKWIAANGYTIGFLIGLIVYIPLMKNDSISFVSDEEEEAMTER